MIFFPKELQVNKDTSFKFCYPFPDEWGDEYAKAVVLAKFLVYYAIPLVIIGIFYIMIAIHLAFGASVPGEMQGAIRQVSLWAECGVQPPTFTSNFISHCDKIHVENALEIFGLSFDVYYVSVCVCNEYASYLFFCVVYFYVCDFMPACVCDDGASF